MNPRRKPTSVVSFRVASEKAKDFREIVRPEQRRAWLEVRIDEEMRFVGKTVDRKEKTP